MSKVTLLAVSSVSKEIRDWMDTHATGQDAERAEDARRTRALVSALLNELLVNASLSSVSLILAAGCKLIGSFSTLLPGNLGGGGTAAGGAGSGAGGASATNGAEGGAEEVGNASGNSMLPLALGYLSAGLQQETSRHQAAISVRTIAASCERGIIADRRALDALLQVNLPCPMVTVKHRWHICKIDDGMFFQNQDIFTFRISFLPCL